MKIKVFSLALLFVSLSFCDKKDSAIDNKPLPNEPVDFSFSQPVKPVLFEYTSTGCPGCGSWGKPTFNSLAQEFNNQIVPVAVHIKYNDPMITSTSNALAANRYGQNYTPQLWVNDTNGVVLSGNINAQASLERLQQLIESNKNHPSHLLDAKVSLSNNTFYLKAGVKAQGSVDDFYISVYLSENGVVHQQAGYASNPATHNYVIRSDVQGPFGVQLLESDFKNGVYVFDTEIEVPNQVKSENAFLTLILWQKIQERFVAVNGLIVK